VITNGNKLDIKSSLLPNNHKTLEFKSQIKKVCSTNENCWILIETGKLFCFDFLAFLLDEISLADVSSPLVEISCTQQALFAVTSDNQLYKLLPTFEKIREFKNHEKIKKIVAGLEHCLLLTTNGDVFSFGCGLRGALGNGDVNSHETPMQVEALSGLKIVDIGEFCFTVIS
jgi:hypothetical protein